MFDSNIVNYSNSEASTSVSTTPYSSETSQKGISGASSIEQSRDVASLLMPLINFPHLVVPQYDLPSNSSSIALIGYDAIQKFNLAMASLSISILETWAKNINENEERIRELINTPEYQARAEIQRFGTSHPTLKSDPTAASDPITSGATPSVDLLNSFNRLHAIKTISEVSKSEASSQDTVMVPFTALMMIGGVLTLGTAEVATSSVNASVNPSSAPSVSAVEQLQTINVLNPADLIPVINLMVAAPLYYRSWEEAVSRFENKERVNQKNLIQNFAKDVIKMVTDPSFIASNLVSTMENMDPTKSKIRDQQVATIKLVLLSVALTLLYSQSVGKVQEGKFWGMEAEEFRGLLNGDIPLPNLTKKSSLEDQLTVKLLLLIKDQLGLLPTAQKTSLISDILNYISGKKDVERMLQPVTVFEEFFAGSAVEDEKKLGQPI